VKRSPYFSVVIPALNEEKYLPRLLSDLSEQNYGNFEVILVDGKSVDATVEKALGFTKKLPELKVVISPKRNVCFQRNLGGEKSLGEWIIFMDADNRIPNYFLEGVKYKIGLSETQIFTCWSEVDSKKTADKFISAFHNLGEEIGVLIDSPTAYGALIGVKKNVFNKLKGFDVRVKFAEDSDFLVRAYKKGYKLKIFHDPKYTYSLRRYRREGTLETLRKTAELHLKNFAKMPVNQEKEYPMGGIINKKSKER
jgi:glycosyltransferase involved in cell wall biosynthesis